MMALDPRPPYPQALCYVLKLHRDSDPGTGRLQGLIEHVASGEIMAFRSADELRATLIMHGSDQRERDDRANAGKEP